MRSHECACVGKGATPIFQMSVPQMPCMNHVWPDLQSHYDVGPARPRGKSSGVIEQGLVRTNLD